MKLELASELTPVWSEKTVEQQSAGSGQTGGYLIQQRVSLAKHMKVYS